MNYNCQQNGNKQHPCHYFKEDLCHRDIYWSQHAKQLASSHIPAEEVTVL